jgi:hypothetical protein
VDPDDFVALEFDRKSRSVLARAGGPDLFESMQELSVLDLKDADDDAPVGEWHPPARASPSS